MIVGYLSFLILIALCLYSIVKVKFFQIEAWSSLPVLFAFGCKLLFAVLVWFIYSYYYADRANADIFKYFDDAVSLFNATEGNFSLRCKVFMGINNSTELIEIYSNTQFWDSQKEVWFNDNRTMTRIHLILLHFSRGLYHLHSLVFAMLSLIGSMGLFKFFRSFSHLPKKLVFVISFFIPSVLFWCSAPLKESFLLFALGITLFGLMQMKRKVSISGLLFLLIGILGMVSLKLYLLVSILPGFLFLLIAKGNSRKVTIVTFASIHLLFVLFFLFFQNEIILLLNSKQQAFKALSANSEIALESFTTLPELISIIPQALFNVLIRPVYPVNWNPFSLLSSLEHIFYLSALFLPIIYFKKPKTSTLSLFCISLVIIVALVIGTTTPILGAIVRYKSPIIPFYLVLIFTFVDFSKLPQRLQ